MAATTRMKKLGWVLPLLALGVSLGACEPQKQGNATMGSSGAASVASTGGAAPARSPASANSASAASAAPPVAGAASIDGAYELVKVGELAAVAEVTLELSAGKTQGKIACNRYNGEFSYEPSGKASFKRPSVTELACQVPAAAFEQEGRFLEALAAADHAEAVGNELRLRGPSGTLGFVRTGDAPPGAAKP